MKTHCRLLIALFLSLPQVLLAGGTLHQYWVCGVTTYQSTVGGKSQSGQCRANTAYSPAPCKEFAVEFVGEKGVRPGAPFEQNINGTTIKIAINQSNDHHAYTHTINKAGNQWVYHGKCNYFEAPASEKLYMDFGLKTQP